MIQKLYLYPEPGETFSSCVIAGDFIFTSHQGGGQSSDDVVVQLEATFRNLENALKAANATLNDVVQINLLLKNAADFQRAQEVFRKVFQNGFPARTTYVTEFVAPEVVVQIDAVAYKKSNY